MCSENLQSAENDQPDQKHDLNGPFYYMQPRLLELRLPLGSERSD